MNAAEQIVEALLEDEERVVAAAVLFNGQVITAPTHAQAYEKAAEAGVFAPIKIYNLSDFENLDVNFSSRAALYRMPSEDGFATDTGRFVDREEAYALMKRERDPEGRVYQDSGYLHSSSLDVAEALLEAGTRRDFLRMLGVGVAGASVAGQLGGSASAPVQAASQAPVRGGNGYFFMDYFDGVPYVSYNGTTWTRSDGTGTPIERPNKPKAKAPEAKKVPLAAPAQGRNERDLPMQRMPESLDEASAPEWVQQRMSARVAAGWNPRWPFVPVDLYNPGFREAIQSDPELSEAEKQQILSFAPGGKNERSLFGESIAVDLDGTLARDNGWKGPEHIGKPIKPMLDLVQKLLDDGEEVVIFTARCHDGKSSTKDYVKQWLKDNGLPDLEVTNEKRPDMEKFYDDKAIEVVTNKGVSESVPWQTSSVIDSISAQHNGWVRIKGSCGHMIRNVRSSDPQIPVVEAPELCRICQRSSVGRARIL